MAERFVSVEFENDREIILRLDTAEKRLSGVSRRIISGAATYGLYWLRLYVPRGESGYILQHTDASHAEFRPGGPGGGGFWQSVVGVKRGRSRHPLYVSQGTGIYAGRGLIRPRHGGFALVSGSGKRGNVLTFKKRGEPRRFVAFVSGQQANHFLYMTYVQVRLYAQARVFTLGPELLG